MADYDDYQVNQFFDLGGGTTSIRITNAAEVDTSGLELEMRYRATDNFTIDASLGLLDASFGDFPNGASLNGTPVNARNNDLPFAADFNAALGLAYFTPLASLGVDLLVRLDVTHTSDYFTTTDNIRQLQLPGLPPGSPGAPGGVPSMPVEHGHVEALTLLNGRIGLPVGSVGLGTIPLGPQPHRSAQGHQQHPRLLRHHGGDAQYATNVRTGIDIQLLKRHGPPLETAAPGSLLDAGPLVNRHQGTGHGSHQFLPLAIDGKEFCRGRGNGPPGFDHHAHRTKPLALGRRQQIGLELDGEHRRLHRHQRKGRIAAGTVEQGRNDARMDKAVLLGQRLLIGKLDFDPPRLARHQAGR